MEIKFLGVGNTDLISHTPSLYGTFVDISYNEEKKKRRLKKQPKKEKAEHDGVNAYACKVLTLEFAKEGGWKEGGWKEGGWKLIFTAVQG
jgi:hypothetical protein